MEAGTAKTTRDLRVLMISILAIMTLTFVIMSLFKFQPFFRLVNGYWIRQEFRGYYSNLKGNTVFDFEYFGSAKTYSFDQDTLFIKPNTTFNVGWNSTLNLIYDESFFDSYKVVSSSNDTLVLAFKEYPRLDESATVEDYLKRKKVWQICYFIRLKGDYVIAQKKKDDIPSLSL